MNNTVTDNSIFDPVLNLTLNQTKGHIVLLTRKNYKSSSLINSYRDVLDMGKMHKLPQSNFVSINLYIYIYIFFFFFLFFRY